MLIDYVKSCFIDLNAENMMIPWIYLCYNKDFTSPATDERKTGNLKQASGNQTSTNINKSAAGGVANTATLNNQINSVAFNDSANNAGITSPNAAGLIPGLTDLEVDYGYNTEEDSIFQSFV